MNNVLQGKVALITGGTSGIGRATALACVQAGARVVVAARGRQRGEATVAAMNEAGGEAIFVAADVTEAAAIENLVAETVASFGRLDVAFNNAASEQGSGSPTADFTEAEYDAVMAANLKGVWLCMKHEIRQMLRQSPPGGSIVNTSSVNGLGGVRNGALYAASKAGVLALTKSAAQEYAQQGIRANALVAGAFATPMLRRAMERNVGDDPEARQQLEAQYAAAIPLQRLGDPAEAAQAVLWLASDAASYVTGHSFIVDGGLTAYAR
jgi:NAD(P)-dependent dehydrogenase (short-subunit alcohol dehydrogenase family)